MRERTDHGRLVGEACRKTLAWTMGGDGVHDGALSFLGTQGGDCACAFWYSSNEMVHWLLSVRLLGDSGSCCASWPVRRHSAVRIRYGQRPVDWRQWWGSECLRVDCTSSLFEMVLQTIWV